MPMRSGKVLSALTLTIVVSVMVSGQQPANSPRSEALASARAIFEKYVALERAFNPALADLYAAEAIIKNKRTYPTGQVREITIPVAQYRELIRQGMPVAKQRGDANTYSNCRYSTTGARVRIGCSRYSELKKYSSPMSLVVGPGANGEWLVFEEISESQP
jgi:hypothetical protein